jgi:hypothetical protein
MADIYIADFGVPFEITIVEDGAAVNISDATTMALTLKKPNGSTLTKTLDFKTDGTDGIVTYTFLTTDLDIAGTWKYQVYIETATSGKHTAHGELDVGGNL